MDDAGLPALVEAIKHLHDCKATWLESIPVHETFNDQVVWDGEVQVFDLSDHPKSKRCYAWSCPTTGTKRRFFAVLSLPPIMTALDAVRASIISDAKTPLK